MDKLVEREASPRTALSSAPALAVQFFVIPLAVVGITVLVYLGFRMLLAGEQRSAQEYLTEVRYGGANRAWPAAYELSKLVVDQRVFQQDPTLARQTIDALRDTRDSRVRGYLLMAVGRMPRPIPADAKNLLRQSLDDPDFETQISAIWALGAAGDQSDVAAILPKFTSDDAGVRKIAAYALGALPGSDQIPALRTSLRDAEVDVRWNAAIALARHGDAEGVPVLTQMLDRAALAGVVRRTPRPWYWMALPTVYDQSDDPVGDVMVAGLQAAAVLKDERLRQPIVAISEKDESLRVRQVAIETLKAMP